MKEWLIYGVLYKGEDRHGLETFPVRQPVKREGR